MTHTSTALLSLLQGATEFLPVSSSGHLRIAQGLAETQGSQFVATDNMPFVVLVHVGTLLAIGWFFRRRIAQLLAYAFLGAWRNTERNGLRAAWLDHSEGRLLLAIVLANIPTAITGLYFEHLFESLYTDPARLAWVGYALLATAILLIATRWARDSRKSPAHMYPLWIALVIGLAQSAALVPGISRSGATIAVALLLGVARRDAGELSFLIAIPAILGAVLLKIVAAPDFTLPLALCVNALAVSAVSGYVFLRLLLRFVQSGRLWAFAAYCVALGLWTIWYF